MRIYSIIKWHWIEKWRITLNWQIHIQGGRLRKWDPSKKFSDSWISFWTVEESSPWWQLCPLRIFCSCFNFITKFFWHLCNSWPIENREKKNLSRIIWRPFISLNPQKCANRKVGQKMAINTWCHLWSTRYRYGKLKAAFDN